MALKKLVSDLTQGLVAYPNHNTPSDSGGFNHGGSTSVFDTKLFQQRTLSYKNPLSRQDNPEPLIPQLLPGVNQEPESSILYLDDAPDGFIRGGVMNAVKRAAYDNIRINRFFNTGRGATFISVQKSLQKSNPIIQEEGGNLNNTVEDAINIVAGTNFTSANTNRIFNEENLVRQVTEGGYTGTYFNRAGVNATVQSDEQNKYEASHKPGRKFDANTMGEFSTQGGLISGNRLVSLGKKLDVGLRTGVNGNVGLNFNLDAPSSIMKQAVGLDVGDLIDTWNGLKAGFNQFFNNPLESLSQPGPFSQNQEIGFKPGENIIYQYTGGPGSTYGIGDTILYRYERTSGDFDHQGHPLSIVTYNKNKPTSIIGSDIQFFNADGSLNTGTFLNVLADSANDTLFGGNNIVGPNGLLFGDNFNFNSPSNILTGLANQVFGEETVNFVTDLFNGGGLGNGTSNSNTPSIIGSYMLGEIQFIDGTLKKDPTVNKTIDARPSLGFIGSYASPTGRGFGNKPDDVAESIRQNLTNNLPLGVGKVISPYGIINNNSSETISKPNESILLNRYQPRVEEYSKNNVSFGKTGGYKKFLSDSYKFDGGKRNYIINSRIGIGDPGATWTDKSVGIDKINALPIETVTDGNFNLAKYRDLVRFRFEAIRTDAPEKSDVMAFRAFLDGWGDNFSSNWNSFKYNGRGEEFFTYGGFKRTFNFSFKVAAQSKQEMKPLYKKLNYLVSNLAPDYSKTGRMRAPYIKLCIGAYMDRTPGFLTSVNIKWRKDYPFEIALSSPEGKEDKEMHVLPHVLDVSCNFTPIHNFVPRKSVEDSPFIIPGANSNLHIPGKTNRKWLSGDNSKYEEKELESYKNVEDEAARQLERELMTGQREDNDIKVEEGGSEAASGAGAAAANFAIKQQFLSTVGSKINSLYSSFELPFTDVDAIGLPNINRTSYDFNGDGVDDIQIIITGTTVNDIEVTVNVDTRYTDTFGGLELDDISDYLIQYYPDIFKNGVRLTVNMVDVGEMQNIQ